MLAVPAEWHSPRLSSTAEIRNTWRVCVTDMRDLGRTFMERGRIDGARSTLRRHVTPERPSAGQIQT
jgi:hypothetical protein